MEGKEGGNEGGKEGGKIYHVFVFYFMYVGGIPLIQLHLFFLLFFLVPVEKRVESDVCGGIPLIQLHLFFLLFFLVPVKKRVVSDVG